MNIILERGNSSNDDDDDDGEEHESDQDWNNFFDAEFESYINSRNENENEDLEPFDTDLPGEHSVSD